MYIYKNMIIKKYEPNFVFFLNFLTCLHTKKKQNTQEKHEEDFKRNKKGTKGKCIKMPLQ